MQNFLKFVAVGTLSVSVGSAVFAQEAVDYATLTCADYSALGASGKMTALQAIRTAGADADQGGSDMGEDGTASVSGPSDGSAPTPEETGQGGSDSGDDGTPSASETTGGDATSTGDAPTPAEAGQGGDASNDDGTPSVTAPLSADEQDAELMARVERACDGTPNAYVLDVANASLQ